MLFMPLFVLLFTSVQAQQKFIIQGKMDGLDNGTRIILYRFIDGKAGQERDTTTIENGEFKFQGKISRPVKVNLYTSLSPAAKTPGIAINRMFFLCPGSTQEVHWNTNMNWK
jgi:Domain of unknown function (DUF4369)